MYYIPSKKDIEKENMKVKAFPRSYIYRYSYQPTFYALALTCRWMASLALPFLYMNPFIFDTSSFLSTIISRQNKKSSTSSTTPSTSFSSSSLIQSQKNENKGKFFFLVNY